MPKEIIEADKSVLALLMKLEQAKTIDDAAEVYELLKLYMLNPETSWEARIWMHYAFDLARKNPVYASLDFSSISGGGRTMLEANLNLIFEDIKRRIDAADAATEAANKKIDALSKMATDARNNILTGIKNLLALGTLSLEQIAQAFNMPVEEVREIKAGMA